MVKLSIAVDGVFGLTWSSWKRLVRATEDLGFHGLYLSDHFNLPEPPDSASLNLMVALTHLADHTERVRFGPMVARSRSAIQSCSPARPPPSTT